MNKTSIVIVTYNGILWLKECLDSCENYSVIIVDNNSTDKTISFIEDNYPEVKLFKQTKNLGFGQANNIGISYALKNGADYIFLLNQDAYLYKNSIETLIKAHKNHPEYGILSPIHLNGNGDKIDRIFSYYLSYDKNDRFYFDAINNSLREVYNIPFVNAAAWFLPRKTLEIVGGFDPIFFHYGEDDNYCQRVLYHSLKIGVVPSSKIRHDRENRKNSDINIFSKKYFKNKEKQYKFKFANINNENWKNEIDKEFLKLKKAKIKSFLFFKYGHAKGYIKQINLLKKIFQEITSSRLNNKIKKSNYLNL